MKLTPLVPALPEGGGAPRWSLAASVALHALLLAAVLLIVIRPPLPSGGAEPSYQLVFQQPADGAPTPAPDTGKTQPLPPAQPADLAPPPDAAPGIPAPAPSIAPDPAAADSPPPPVTAAVPSEPTPVPAISVPIQPSPTPPPLASVAAAPTSSAPPPVAKALPDQQSSLPLPLDIVPTGQPPNVRLELPPTEAAPAPPEPIMPQLPPPLPTPRPQPRPAIRPSTRQGFGTLTNPMDLSLAPAAPRPAARGTVASRSLDLSPPKERQGSAKPVPNAQIRAANASAEWINGIITYWHQHSYYPQQAIENDEEGMVSLRLVVSRSGRVESVELLSGSGSPWLNMAAMGTWRGAKLPHFTADMSQDQAIVLLDLTYHITRH